MTRLEDFQRGANALAEAALAYARLGIAVFPLRPNTKLPYGHSLGFLSATTDLETIAGWWSGKLALPLTSPEPGKPDFKPVYPSPQSNIGIATGKISGFWVFDLDGDVGEASAKALTDVHGELPETVEQITGGGRHQCFAWDDRFQIKSRASKIGPQIDVRGNGGYIVAPPSIHPGDEKKGIPAGRIYTWCARRAPFDRPFAQAPDWLLRLAEPPEQISTAAKPLVRVIRSGRATRYGEAILSTSCKAVAAAGPGQRRISVFNYGCFLGAYVAGGEIDRAYAKESLISAGHAQHQDTPWHPKQLEELVENGLRKGELKPESAPERKAFEPAAPRRVAVASAAAQAVDVRNARQLWASARSADCGMVRTWFRHRNLNSADLPETLSRLRAHAGAPIGQDRLGPCLLIPLTASNDPDWAGDVEAVALIPLIDDHDRPTAFVGDRSGKVALLSSWPADGALLIAQDLQDTWALGVAAAESGHDVGLVFAPTLSAFAGGFMGDRYGRADAETPISDPSMAPWTVKGARQVWLAVRDDLRTPELRTRRIFGGTRKNVATGQIAARFYAGLAEQAWRRAGATAVHVMRPSSGVGFSDRWRNS
jgi:hypothetical protein